MNLENVTSYAALVNSSNSELVKTLLGRAMEILVEIRNL
jgi:hypothetical protein